MISFVSNPTSDLLSGSIVVISMFCFYCFLVVGFLFLFSSFFVFVCLFLVVIFVCFILHQMKIQATTTLINGFSFMPWFICRVLVYSRFFMQNLIACAELWCCSWDQHFSGEKEMCPSHSPTKKVVDSDKICQVLSTSQPQEQSQ